MDRTTAARAIVAWVEKRFYREFWYCKQCAWDGYAVYEHHSRISNFGVCTSCHSHEDIEQMDYECDMGPSKTYHAERKLRWVGPRFDRVDAHSTRIACA